MRILLSLLLLPLPLSAADYSLLAGDRVLEDAELTALTDREVVEFYEGGQSRYSADGGYSYTYQSGGRALGTYEIGTEGMICILFDNGRDRCDRFVTSHGRVVMITEEGERYPIRPE
ncbi:MAG: hypothetical protein P1U53_03125 [Sulfitobacter sp.]|nr:hypothetical protein [Sulfitobacter sp.]